MCKERRVNSRHAASSRFVILIAAFFSFTKYVSRPCIYCAHTCVREYFSINPRASTHPPWRREINLRIPPYIVSAGAAINLHSRDPVRARGHCFLLKGTQCTPGTLNTPRDSRACGRHDLATHRGIYSQLVTLIDVLNTHIFYPSPPPLFVCGEMPTMNGAITAKSVTAVNIEIQTFLPLRDFFDKQSYVYLTKHLFHF